MPQTRSLWTDTNVAPQHPPLDRDTTADTCIVGGGIAGLMTAYGLTRAGQSVILLESGTIGCGESGRTTAHLTAALDDRYFRIEKMHGVEAARLAAESHMAAIHRIESIVLEEGIECDFGRVDGYLIARASGSERHARSRLQEELAALHRAGLNDVRMVTDAPVDFGAASGVLHFPLQAKFHPMKFMHGIAGCITRDGGRIFERTHVDRVEGGDAVRVTTADGHTVIARAVVICTNASIEDTWITHSKQAPYRTYVVAAQIPGGSVPVGLYWDDEDPYHYVRVASSADPALDYLVVGGEDHKTGHETDGEERFDRLETWTRARFPQARDFTYHWSGQVLEPFDYLAFTGRAPDGARNVYMHSGDSGNGMTHGTIAGILLTDLVVGRANPWESLYDPRRVSLRAAPEFIRQNADVVIQFTDYIGPADKPDDIPCGGGRLLRQGARRIAAYRDHDGVLHSRSAVCTHLGCAVHWNPVESSWDCPCHGSRFDPYGNVISGPATAPLHEVEATDERAAM